MYMLQYANTFYYPLPPKTDGKDLQTNLHFNSCNHVMSSRGFYPYYIHTAYYMMLN